MCELTTSTRAQISDAWPAVTYKGQPLFDRYIAIIPDFEDKVGCDNQECYLGYVPSEDAFIIGFDAWPEMEEDEDGEEVEEDYSNVFKFKWDNHQNAEEIFTGERMFYSGSYRTIGRRYKDLLDIRLD